jgi:branched-chain amino acid transport system ATP-binding protein
MSEPLLAVEDLHGYYGTAHVLRGVSFSMGAEPVAVIGRNGIVEELVETIKQLAGGGMGLRGVEPLPDAA